MRRLFCYGCFAYLLLNLSLNAQSRLQRLKQSDLLKLDGAVPTYHPPGYEAMARRDQASLEAAIRWIEAQMGVRRPVQLVLLDEKHWHTFTGYPYPTPCSDSGQALILLPVDLGDLGAGLQLTDEGKRDLMAFHEAGHIYAHAAHLDNFNDALTDLYADLFAASYVRTSRADLSAVLHIEMPTRDKRPHISRLNDWNFLSDDLDVKTFDWFEVQLARIASFVTSTRNLKDLVPMLQAKFPADEVVMSEQVAERFEAITPGFRDVAGDLLGPPTLPEAKVGPCQGRILSEGHIPVVFLNRTKRKIQVAGLNGKNLVVEPGWQKLHANTGQEIRLTESACAVVGGGPTLVDLTFRQTGFE